MSCVNCLRRAMQNNRVITNSEYVDVLFIDNAPTLIDAAIGKACGQPLYRKVLQSLISNKTFEVCCMVKCPGSDPIPSETEILCCKDKVMEFYKAINPLLVVFLTKEAERFYKKEFHFTASAVHPEILLKKGWQRSPLFIHNVNIIKRALHAAQKTVD